MLDLAHIAARYDIDKAVHQHYLRNYEEYFDKLRGEEVLLLELGIKKGGSLLLWRDYFEKGIVVGLDIEPARLDDTTGRVRVYQGAQQDAKLLDRIARENAPAGFDIIIDDCAHIGVLARESFRHLLDKHLKPAASMSSRTGARATGTDGLTGSATAHARSVLIPRSIA